MSAPSSDKAGIRQTIRALRAAGWNLGLVDDSEERIDVSSEAEAIDAITAVDDAFLTFTKGDETAWVRFVLGNDPDEVICDHTVNLTDVLDPLVRSWW